MRRNVSQGIKVGFGREWSKLWNTEEWWVVWETLLKLSGRDSKDAEFSRLLKQRSRKR